MLTSQSEKKRIDSDYYIEGYATTFDPYILYHDYDGSEVYERINKTAFNGAKMDDVIFQFDHEGIPYARMSNNTLGIEVNDNGLFMWADLGTTARGKELYEQISAGLITKMSWAFTVAPDGESYDELTKTININQVREVFDVSAVSIPANDQTSISARSKELIEACKHKYELEERKKKKLNLMLKLGGQN